MPALNKDNIRGLVTFDHPEILWEALKQKKGVVMLACHIDNWEWLGAALALNGFPLSARISPQRRGKTAAQQSVFRFYERIAKRGRAGNLRAGQQ